MIGWRSRTTSSRCRRADRACMPCPRRRACSRRREHAKKADSAAWPARARFGGKISRQMNLFKAIGLKLGSALLFTVMSALIRLLGEVTPVGEVVFFRGLFAVVPVLVIYAWRGKIIDAIHTRQPF